MQDNKIWIVYSTTEDDFIEYERCAEQLKEFGFDEDEIGSMALSCHICPISKQCHVARENAFLGVKSC